MVWMVADASCASTTGSAVSGSSPLLPGKAEAGGERLVEFGKSVQHHGADLRIGHRFRRRRHHREAAARTGLAGEINIERHRVDALQPFADRQLVPENVDHRRARIGAIARIALDVEFALVAERAVEARPVHAGGGAEIVERRGGKTILAKQIERLAERDLGLIGARPAAALRRSGASAFAVAAFYFFVPFRNKFLDAIYIMRNSIKINHGSED